MKEYTDSEARQNLVSVLDAARKDGTEEEKWFNSKQQF